MYTLKDIKPNTLVTFKKYNGDMPTTHRTIFITYADFDYDPRFKCNGVSIRYDYFEGENFEYLIEKDLGKEFDIIKVVQF